TPRPDTSAARSRNTRWCRWATRASAASVSTNGSAAHGRQPDPASEVRPGSHPLVRAGARRRTKGATMTIKLVALVVLCLMTGTAMAEEPKVTSLVSKELPQSPGREALMITVEHAPGGSSAIHRHNAHAFVYVLEGSVVMQLKGGQQVTLTPGQSFYEGPDDVHVIDRNASSTQPAKFLVVLIKDKGAPPVVPAIDCSTLIALVTLKKIVPNLVQLSDCRFKRRDKEPPALAAHETKAIEGLERIGNLEINIDRKVFCEPPLDTVCNVGCCWSFLRLADEMICKGRFLGLLVLGSGDQIVENARIIIDIAKIDIFGELHVILQGLMLIFQPLTNRKATERHNPQQGNKCPLHIGVFNRP